MDVLLWVHSADPRDGRVCEFDPRAVGEATNIIYFGGAKWAKKE